MYADIGFWHEWSRKMLPSTYFLLQRNAQDFNELVAATTLPAFSSDVVLRHGQSDRTQRVYLPILDPEAHVTYYGVCRSEDQKLFSPIFREMKARGL